MTDQANSLTLREAIDELADVVRTSASNIEDVLRRLSRPGGDTCDSPIDVPRRAYSDDREEVLVRVTAGTGRWDADKRYNLLEMKMFKMNGDPDGTHTGVWEPQVGIEELTITPPPPRPPLDRPEGPVPGLPPRAFTKAIWTFGDGSSVTAVGPAELYLVPFNDDSYIFLVSVAAIMTGGTGKYEGARGIKTALGSTFVPKGSNLLNPPDGKFGAVTVETFRIIRGEYLK